MLKLWMHSSFAAHKSWGILSCEQSRFINYINNAAHTVFFFFINSYSWFSFMMISTIIILEICTQHLSLIIGSFVWNWYAKNDRWRTFMMEVMLFHGTHRASDFLNSKYSNYSQHYDDILSRICNYKMYQCILKSQDLTHRL